MACWLSNGFQKRGSLDIYLTNSSVVHKYKLFKDQIIVLDNKKEDGVKTEDDEIIVGYFYIGDEYKNLIGKIFKYELMMEIYISQILMIELAYQKLLMNIWEKKVLI